MEKSVESVLTNYAIEAINLKLENAQLREENESLVLKISELVKSDLGGQKGEALVEDRGYVEEDEFH